jgi:anti-anti-sigma factor
MSTDQTGVPPPTTVAHPTLSLHVLSEGHHREVVVSGEIDMSTAQLLTELVGRIAMDRPDRVVIDLGGVTFFCAAGIRALLTARQTIAITGGQLFIRGQSSITRRILQITGADAYLPVEPSVDRDVPRLGSASA